MIAIIDYDMGNVGSIKNILHRIGVDDVVVTRDISCIKSADKYILPGVGAFDAGIDNLEKFGLKDIIIDQVGNRNKYILGICLGMQLLGGRSEEGTKRGLNVLPFDTVKFELPPEYKIPHMGWNEVNIVQERHPLVNNLMGDIQRYYFVHSFHARCNEDIELMNCDYGYSFTAAVARDNIMGVQFHPEKSHLFGMKLLENFVRL